MGAGEAGEVATTGQIPNTNAEGRLKDIHVTTDKPMDSASAASKHTSFQRLQHIA